MSSKDEWVTPDRLFHAVNSAFIFSLDVCATTENKKCTRFFAKKDDGLSQSWGLARCWMNPPYSDIATWIAKATEEARSGAFVVGLLPSDPSTRWFAAAWDSASEVVFLAPRVPFYMPGRTSTSPSFASVMFVWSQGGGKSRRHVWRWNWKKDLPMAIARFRDQRAMC